MWILARPLSDADEDKALTSILAKPEFHGQVGVWTQAYSGYRAVSGDPWQIAPVGYAGQVKAAQLKLYDNRRSSGTLKRIRDTVGPLCCPMCGSPGIGSLDHYLPKEDYPEFSVFPTNCLPACSPCNSGAKGRTFKGAAAGDRFLHPYYDTLAAVDVWRIEVRGNLKAPEFVPVPEPGLSPADTQMMAFHIDHVLGNAFYTAIQTAWQNIWVLVADHMQVLGLDGPQAVAAELRRSARSTGRNGWRASLLRGIRSDPQVEAFVIERAEEVTLPDDGY